MRDLNSRPSRCKRVALPTELIAHILFILIISQLQHRDLKSLLTVLAIYEYEHIQYTLFLHFNQGYIAQFNIIMYYRFDERKI